MHIIELELPIFLKQKVIAQKLSRLETQGWLERYSGNAVDDGDEILKNQILCELQLLIPLEPLRVLFCLNVIISMGTLKMHSPRTMFVFTNCLIYWLNIVFDLFNLFIQEN